MKNNENNGALGKASNGMIPPKKPSLNPPKTPYRSKLADWKPTEAGLAAVMAAENAENEARNKGKIGRAHV